ncbi:MAG: nucleotide exchange factor GrpE [Candidatus Omnitrophica bacterium]|nr:nucleotide exchange factor GrpE [Candidatus Omnitrophota bacterium]
MKSTDRRLEALREELEARCKELEAKTKEMSDLRGQTLRLQADFDNAKKRWLKEQAEFQETANGELLRQLLEIHDDFERALAARPAPVGVQAADEFQRGVEMIAKRLAEFLKSYGVVPMEPKGKPFDPNQHEAVAHEATEAVPESTILEELRKGYWMNGRVLRHAVVKVAVKLKGSDPLGPGPL